MTDPRQNGADQEIERLHQELEEVRRQLERSDRDFEEFVCMAAHNLRQSLREVASFSQLMSETYASRLDADAGAFLDRIQRGAARMQSLLTDVVDYWATGNGGRQCSRTEMEDALRQALLCADRQIAERSAVISHDPLPAVMGDFETVTKLLHHLIKNAIEYGGSPAPRVHVSSRRADPDLVFSVKDNGPGIEPEFQSRIFLAFRRLHGTEFPGNGLGLAFCKKAIERHGGRMWMESEPGSGSTFYFTLPAAD